MSVNAQTLLCFVSMMTREREKKAVWRWWWSHSRTKGSGSRAFLIRARTLSKTKLTLIGWLIVLACRVTGTHQSWWRLVTCSRTGTLCFHTCRVFNAHFCFLRLLAQPDNWFTRADLWSQRFECVINKHI
jgi:hypothetical protein